MSDFRDPFGTASWPLVPGRTVLVNIDLQNDFLHPDGWYAKNNIDISHMQRVVEPVKQLVAACRSHGMPVVWTRHGTHGVEDGGPFMELRPVLRDGGLRTGTWGYEILADLQPQAGDRFVEKNRLSAFFQTNLELVLRGLGAETVLIAGEASMTMQRKLTDRGWNLVLRAPYEGAPSYSRNEFAAEGS